METVAVRADLVVIWEGVPRGIPQKEPGRGSVGAHKLMDPE